MEQYPKAPIQVDVGSQEEIAVIGRRIQAADGLTITRLPNREVMLRIDPALWEEQTDAGTKNPPAEIELIGINALARTSGSQLAFRGNNNAERGGTTVSEDGKTITIEYPVRSFDPNAPLDKRTFVRKEAVGKEESEAAEK